LPVWGAGPFPKRHHQATRTALLRRLWCRRSVWQARLPVGK